MVKTRFAPSPTGYIHIGGIRTALYSYACAKKAEGKFILRIEDTDKSREMEGGIRDIIEALNIFGLKYDEGPEVGGSHKPYIQSKRLDIYKEKAQELVEKGVAYYCFCSKERLDKLRKEQQKKGKKPMYDKKCREIAPEEAKKRIKNGDEYVVRLKVPAGRRLSIKDTVMGDVSWNTDEVDDQVLLKSDGYPTYHLAVVVDDVLMGVTHITRGIEWLASVPKHLLLFEAFGYKVPVMAHMPVILDPDGGKLSKRKGSVSVEDFLKQGYLPEALLNFLMLLGWAPSNDQEFFTLEEFVEAFSLDDLNKSSPVFDREKLLWFNGEYIRKLSVEELAEKICDWANENCEDGQMVKWLNDDDELGDKVVLLQERMSLLSESVDSLKFFYERQPIPDPAEIKGVKRYGKDDYQKVLCDYKEIVEKYDDDSSKWKHEKWEQDIRDLADKYEWKHGDMFMMVRLAMCGSPISPPLFESMVILGKGEVVDRVGKAEMELGD